jgi:hypothetical protein
MVFKMASSFVVDDEQSYKLTLLAFFPFCVWACPGT